MSYGTIKVDTITFTDGGVDKSVSVSGLTQNPTFSGDLTVTGTISGVLVQGQTVSGTTVTGTTAVFTSGVFTNISGGTHTITSGVFAAGSAASPSISFTSDPDTGLYSPGANQLALSTNGTGRLFVDSSGNVGIGTTPGDLLHVMESSASAAAASTASVAQFERNGACAITISSTDATTGTLFFGDTASAGIGRVQFDHSDNSLQFWSTLERARIDSSGRLGIGTSSPVSALCNTATAPPWSYTGGFIWQSSSANYATSVINTNAGAAYGLRAHVNDTSASSYPLYVSTGAGAGSARLVVNGAGNVGIGTTSPGDLLHIQAASPVIRGVDSDNNAIAKVNFGSGNITLDADVSNTSASSIINFKIDGNEAARIDSSGRLLVGTSTNVGSDLVQIENNSGNNLTVRRNTNAQLAPSNIVFARSRGTSNTSFASLANNDWIGRILFRGADGTTEVQAASIAAQVDGTPGANDMPGRLVFSTTADGASSPTERMRISSAGDIYTSEEGVNNASSVLNTNGGLKILSWSSTSSCQFECFTASAATRYAQVFVNQNGIVGSISTAASATAYNTSSDYRLKENILPVTDGITRLQQLKPSRFNFIADPNKTVDGFIAHEAAAVVPEAVTGEKDAVDDDGNPIYQGIDQSKLVPLLTAALQEAIGRIETLEAEVAALKA